MNLLSTTGAASRCSAIIQLLVAAPILGLINPAVVAAHTCAKGNCVNGHGLMVYPDGGSYEGQFKDGRFEGRGVKLFDDGGSYEGEFKGGRYEGKGTRVWGDGEKYVGEFRGGMKDGQGTYTTLRQIAAEELKRRLHAS